MTKMRNFFVLNVNTLLENTDNTAVIFEHALKPRTTKNHIYTSHEKKELF